MTRNAKIYIHITIAGFTLTFWLWLFFGHIQEKPANHYYEAVMSVTPLLGGIFGLHTAKHWSGFKSQVGQAIIFISLGLIAWGLGQSAWTYYNFAQGVDAPYPSWADAGYISAVPFWALGVYKLSKATGAKYGLRKNWGKAALVAVPVISFAVSYYLLVTVARGGAITAVDNETFSKLFFDFAYPLGDVIIITLAFTIVGLSWKYMGGRFKKPILFTLAGFVLMYCADFSFSYTTTKNTFYSGDWVDLLFSMVMVVLSIGIILLDPTAQPKPKGTINLHLAPER